MTNQVVPAAPVCSVCHKPFKTDKAGNAIHDDCNDAPLPLPVQFLGMVFFAICAGIALNLFHCLAHLKRIDRLDVDWRSLPLFVGCLSVFVVILGVMVFLQEKHIEVRKHPVIFVAAFVVAALISGYFYYSPCPEKDDSPSHASPTNSQLSR
jgi:Na+/glutamate symporter